MNIFISWSGDTSKKIAKEIKNWLPKIIQSAKPYYTPDDIAKGDLWDREIYQKLNECLIGIICLTKDNTEKPWILFEAGALSNKLDKSKVCPIVFGLNKLDVTGPLARFQATDFNKLEMFDLVKSINNSMEENGINEGLLTTMFETFYPELELKVNEILKTGSAIEVKSQRSDRELLEEVLELVRKQNNIDVVPKYSKELIGKRIETYERMMQVNNFMVGDRVIVDKFGEGVVESVGNSAKGNKIVIINFDDGTTRAYNDSSSALHKL